MVMFWLTFLVLVILSKKVQSSYTVKRAAWEEHDQLIFSSDDSKNPVFNKKSFREIDHRCVESFYTIASSPTTLFCYKYNKLQEKEKCMNQMQVIEAGDKSQPMACSITKIKTLYVWDWKDWIEIPYANETSELGYDKGIFKFKNRIKWDGLLLKIQFFCKGLEELKCTLVKLTGERIHPLPLSIKDILNQNVSPTQSSSTASIIIKPKKSSTINTGIIAGIVTIAIIIIAILIFVLVMKLRRKKGKSDASKDLMMTNNLDDTEYSYFSKEDSSRYANPDGPIELNNTKISTIQPYKVKTLECAKSNQVNGKQKNEYYSTAYSWRNRKSAREQDVSPPSSQKENTSNYYSTPINEDDKRDLVKLSQLYAKVNKSSDPQNNLKTIESDYYSTPIDAEKNNDNAEISQMYARINKPSAQSNDNMLEGS